MSVAWIDTQAIARMKNDLEFTNRSSLVTGDDTNPIMTRESRASATDFARQFEPMIDLKFPELSSQTSLRTG